MARRKLLVVLLLVVLVAAAAAFLGSRSQDQRAVESLPIISGPSRTIDTFDQPTSPTPVLPETDPPDAGTVECLQRTADAQLAFQPTKTMIVGHQATIRIIISAQPFSSSPSLPGQDPVVTEQVSLGCYVQAKLIGGTAFDVDPAGPQSESFMRTDQITFDWIITPKKVGVNDLELRIEQIEPVGNDQIPSNAKAITATITVNAKAEHFGDRLYRYADALVKFPLIAGASSVAAAIGLISLMRRRKTSAE